MNILPTVGQRWLWNLCGASIVVIEITEVNANQVDFVYVQIILKRWPDDVLGHKEHMTLSTFVLCNQQFVLLVGQDKSRSE